MSARNRRSLSTVNRSTDRLRRSARAELCSAGGRSNLIPTSLAAPSTSWARVDEMTWVKMFSDIHSGRVLHRTRLRGYRAKGSAIATTAATAPARQRCERGRGGGGFIVTLALRRCARAARTTTSSSFEVTLHRAHRYAEGRRRGVRRDGAREQRREQQVHGGKRARRARRG